MDHYLLQSWLYWWQGAGFGLTAVFGHYFKGNASDAPERDLGNLVVSSGSGWAVTRDAFFDLTGGELPGRQPEDGRDAVRDTTSSLLHQFLESIFWRRR